MRACGLSVALGALALPSGVQAQAVHKCRVNGQLVYQQAPCAHASQRETLSEDGISVIGGNPAPARAEPAPTPRPRAKPAPEPSPAATRRAVSDEQRQEERAERERSGLCVKLREASCGGCVARAGAEYKMQKAARSRPFALAKPFRCYACASA